MRVFHFLSCILLIVFSVPDQLSGQNLEQLTLEFVTYELQTQDLEKAKTYFSPDATFQWPNGYGEKLTVDKFIDIRIKGKEKAKSKIEIDAVYVVGDESIVFADWTATIIHNPKKPEEVGRVATVPFVYRFLWENGKIKHMEMYWDNKKIEKDFGRYP